MYPLTQSACVVHEWCWTKIIRHWSPCLQPKLHSLCSKQIPGVWFRTPNEIDTRTKGAQYGGSVPRWQNPSTIARDDYLRSGMPVVAAEVVAGANLVTMMVNVLSQLP
jgi:hypothetical protein